MEGIEETVEVEEKVKVPVPVWDTVETLKAMVFDDLAERRIEAEMLKKMAEADLKQINADIEAALVVADIPSVMYLHYKVTRRSQRSASSISPHRLLEKGVDPEVIGYATVPGTAYSFVEFRDTRPKPKKTVGETFV